MLHSKFFLLFLKGLNFFCGELSSFPFSLGCQKTCASGSTSILGKLVRLREGAFIERTQCIHYWQRCSEGLLLLRHEHRHIFGKLELSSIDFVVLMMRMMMTRDGMPHASAERILYWISAGSLWICF